MRPPVFDQIERFTTAPKGHEESSFAFFNRIDGEFWQSVRERIQNWAGQLPDGDYRDFRARIRAGNDYQFNSAYLELYLHESLRRAGYAITVHPSTASGRRPDFFAARDGGGFYLEAIAPAPSPAEQARAARLARLYSVVERTGDANWWLWFEHIEEGVASPPASKLRMAIRTWLATLDPAARSDIRDRPVFQWASDGWTVSLTALPRPTGGPSGPTARSIGVFPATVGFVDDSSPLKQALARKHSAYGKLEEALIIAVGVYNFDRDRCATANALWGHEAVQISANDTDDHGTLIRQPDGYFGTPGAWRHSNVSGVLVVNQLQPTHFPTADVSLWLHPTPTHRLPSNIGLPGEVITLVGNQLATSEPAVTPGQFFDLPEVWPPGEAFSRDA